LTDQEEDEVRRLIEEHLGLRATPRMGRITSYDPLTHSVKVAVLPEADFPLNEGDVSETGWIPWSPACAGNGWGIYAPPAIGTQVMLNHQEDSAGAPVGVASINDLSHPPPNVPIGEIWAVHQSGSFFKMTTDGHLLLNGNLEVNVTGPTIKVTAMTAIALTAPRIDLNPT
jgi:phage baseplate assembly protein gpV